MDVKYTENIQISHIYSEMAVVVCHSYHGYCRYLLMCHYFCYRTGNMIPKVIVTYVHARAHKHTLKTHFVSFAKLTKFPPHCDFSLTVLRKISQKHSKKRIKAFLQQVIMLLFYIFPPTARPHILHGRSYETDLALLH